MSLTKGFLLSGHSELTFDDLIMPSNGTLQMLLGLMIVSDMKMSVMNDERPLLVLHGQLAHHDPPGVTASPLNPTLTLSFRTRRNLQHRWKHSGFGSET